MILFEMHICIVNLDRWKKTLCLKIDNNEVSTNESLPLGYAWHSCMYVLKDFVASILEILFPNRQ